MAVLDAKRTYHNLLSKGFVTRKGDHKFLEYYFNGKFILHTKISHGEKELESFHIGMMSRQCKLDKSSFIDLANCPLSADKYLTILKQAGIISESDIAQSTSIPTKNKNRKK